MSAAAKKKDDELPLEAVDQATDRELKLAKNFEDPALEELIPGIGGSPDDEPIALSVTEEAADAVRELVQDATASESPVIDPASIDLSSAFSADALELPLPEPAGEDAPATELAFPVDAAPSSPPPALPKTVNPNPDPLERSVLLVTPRAEEQSRPIGEPPPVAVGQAQSEAIQNGTTLRISEALFELVVCECNFDELVLRALKAIVEGVNAYTGSVLELDHEHEDFFFRAAFGGSASHTKLKAFRVPLNKGIVGHVAESGQPLLIRNLAEDAKQMRAISLSVGFEALTCMAAPILVANQPYGVIEVFNKRDGSLFGESDLAVLEAGVRMLAKVLESRFLMAELSRRVR